MANAQFIRKQIQQKTGIPISIGLGPTKTLAKLANSIAKKNIVYQNVLDLTNNPDLDTILKNVEIGDIWGIGYRYAEFLRRSNIMTAYQFKQCDEAWVRKKFNY